MNKPKARRDNIVVQELENETLIYDLNENRAFCLNETSALIWQLCDGSNSIVDISDELSKKLKINIEIDFVSLALDQLERDGLLDGKSRDYFNGLSRREVVRKIGFASIVTLPVVSSLVVPTTASAQSCLITGTDNCGNDNSQCCSNSCLPVGGITGRCCATGSSGANGPGFNLCQPGPTCPSTFSDLCCSGGSFVNPPAGTCAPNEVRCQCNPY